MARVAVLIYGVVAYLIAMASLVYAVGFVENMWVPKSIDIGPTSPFLTALIINLLLLGLFAIQHSTMARQGFKKVLTGVLPEAAEGVLQFVSVVNLFGLGKEIIQNLNGKFQ